MHVQTRYSGTLRKHVGKGKLNALKSHDHHVLLQQIMLATVRHTLQPGPREAIIKILHFFQCLCSKVVDLSTIPNLLECVVEAFCLFEMWFPSRFFDIMTHLPVHLVEELYWCGPVHARCCYSMERYMGLTKYVHDRSKPEASMAIGYSIDEALGFCTEYFKLYPHSKRRCGMMKRSFGIQGELPQGARKQITLSRQELKQIHQYVISNSLHTVELLRYIEAECMPIASDLCPCSCVLFWSSFRKVWKKCGHMCRELQVFSAALDCADGRWGNAWPTVRCPCNITCLREYEVIAQEREDERLAFRLRWRARYNGSTRYRYPAELQPLAPFADWLYSHVRRLRSEGFPIPGNLVRLMSLPSK